MYHKAEQNGTQAAAEGTKAEDAGAWSENNGKYGSFATKGTSPSMSPPQVLKFHLTTDRQLQ